MPPKDDAKKPPVKPEVPLEVPSRDRTMKVTFSLQIDKAVQSKLPFLLLCLVLFFFACVMLAKANFSFGDVFDFQRIEHNVEKLYSLSFLLFIVLYSMTLALSAMYGFNLRTQTVLLSMLFVVFPFAIASYMFPRYVLAFLALAFPVVMTAFFISMQEKLNLSSLYNSMSKALLLFMVLAVAFTFVKVQGDKDLYFDSFLFNVAKLAPSLQGQLQGSVASAIENIEINGTALAESLQSKGGGNGPLALLSREKAAEVVETNYNKMREIVLARFTEKAERDYAASKIPLYSGLTQSDKDSFINQLMAQFTVDAAASGDNTALVESLWPKIREALAEQVRTAELKEVKAEEIPKLKGQLLKIPMFESFYSNFEVFISLIVLSLVSILVWVLKLVGSLFGLGITKLIM